MKTYAERTLIVPKGVVLTDDEIKAVLTAADERKRNGESGITTVPDPEDGYQIRVPKTAALSHEEAVAVLAKANEAKEYAYADLLVTFADAKVVKCWLTIKRQGLPSGNVGPQLVGRPVKEF